MRGQRKNPRKAVQPFENKKRKIDIFKNYEANGVEKIQRKLEIFSTLISKKSKFTKKTISRELRFSIPIPWNGELFHKIGLSGYSEQIKVVPRNGNSCSVRCAGYNLFSFIWDVFSNVR